MSALFEKHLITKELVAGAEIAVYEITEVVSINRKHFEIEVMYLGVLCYSLRIALFNKEDQHPYFKLIKDCVLNIFRMDYDRLPLHINRTNGYLLLRPLEKILVRKRLEIGE